MRFLQIVSNPSGVYARHDPEHLAQIRKAIEEQIASGKLIATGALGQRATSAARITARAGSVTVEDPPAGDGWLAGGGYSIFEADSKEEAVARAKAQLAFMGSDAVIELIQVTETYPRPAQRSDG